jgi:hypothetical protein
LPTGDSCRDVLDHAVGEIFLLRIAAHIGEGQHGNRRLVGQRQCGRRSCRLLCRWRRANAVNAQRPSNVFQALLADVGKLSLDLAAHLAKGVIGNADAAGFGDPLQPRRNVDPVTENVIALDQDIAEMDADAPFHSVVNGATSIPFRR